MASLLEAIQAAKQRGEKKLAVLIDPDKTHLSHLDSLLDRAVDAAVDYFLVGGSLLVDSMLEECLQVIRERSRIPTILFPGNTTQISRRADALLFLSLISGRNADLLIGNHVVAAPQIRKSALEVMPTGYMLVEGGVSTSVQYISNTQPIPADKDDIAVCTAMAGELLGLRLIYMDAGSGARNPVSDRMIGAVSRTVSVPLLVGGGIRTPQVAAGKARAGADIVVVGNMLEKNPDLVHELAAAVHSAGLQAHSAQ
ncbi:MAG: hypothetical protein RLY31_2064 [Bacteroidota bacterium]|jgi:putative glycerol-1-phosphate prenyltransferase